MTNDYKYLITMFKTRDSSFDPDEEDFRLVLHDLAISENSKGLEELSEAYTGFYFRVYKNHFRDYPHAKETAMADLDTWAAEADTTFKIEKSRDKEGIGYIQKFCRRELKYAV